MDSPFLANTIIGPIRIHVVDHENIFVESGFSGGNDRFLSLSGKLVYFTSRLNRVHEYPLWSDLQAGVSYTYARKVDATGWIYADATDKQREKISGIVISAVADWAGANEHILEAAKQKTKQDKLLSLRNQIKETRQKLVELVNQHFELTNSV